jgi:hypothetical protein
MRTPRLAVGPLFLLLTAAPLWAGGYGQPPLIAGEGATGVATGLDCLDCVTLGVETQGNYAASAAESGPATNALALVANGLNCAPGLAPLGVDQSGAAEGCFDIATQSELIGFVPATASALAGNGANCAPGFSPLGVDATGAVESCFDSATQGELDTHGALTATAHGATSTNLPTTLMARDGAGQVAATTFTGALAGNATTATALAANGANCAAGLAPLGVSSTGAVESCFDVATQSEFAAQVGNTGANGNEVRVSRTTNLSVTSAVDVCIPFDAEWSDVPGWHSTATNTERITVGLAGWYVIVGHTQMPGLPTGAYFVNLRYNGVTLIGSSGGTYPAQTNVLLLSVTTLYFLAAGDFVELCVYQTSGATQTIELSPNRSPILSLARLGP